MTKHRILNDRVTYSSVSNNATRTAPGPDPCNVTIVDNELITDNNPAYTKPAER